MAAEHRAGQDRLRGGDGGVGVAHLRVRDLPALDDELRLDAEERGLPQHEVGELAGLDGADLAVEALGDGRVDRVLGDIATCPVVVGAAVAGQGAAPLASSRARSARCAGSTSPTRPMAWESEEMIEMAPRSCRMSSARDGGGPDPGLGEGEVLGHGRVEVVADHQHVEVFLDGVDGVRPGRVGGAGQDVRLGDHGDDVGRVPAARTLGVVRVDAAPGDRGEGVADESGLVQGVRVDGELGAGLARRRSGRRR